MKNCYIDRDTRSIADLTNVGEMVPGTMTITRINVPAESRGKGLGSMLLKQICTDADAEGVGLSLEIVPSGPLDYQDLYRWYGRYGFEWIPKYYCMIRTPQGKKATDG